MPKILQNENGSEPNLFKIQKGSNIWTNLAVPINTSVDFSSQMKKSVRPLFSILLFMVFVATLSFRAAIHGGGSGGRFFFNSVELENKGPVQTTAPVFNSTLLKYATIDLGEDKTKLEIQQLLEGDLDGSRGRYRTISTWRRFHHDVRMTPSSGNSFRSPSFYRYWLDFRRNLNDWARKKRLQADIMNDLIELVKNPIDRHNGLFTDLGKRYKTCAVVGNSGILLKSNYGKLIDTHEMVIRLNNAKTDRYEQNVGSKTGLSFVNSNILHLCARRQGCFCHPYGDNIPIIMYICQPIHFLDYTVCNSSHKSPLLVTDPRFDSLCARIVKYYSVKLFVEELEKQLNEWSLAHDGSLFHYSSGMQAVMVALGICDKVSMFGFGKSASAKHHYHTNQKAELHLHDYEAEYRFYSDLVENPRAIPFISDKFKVPPVKIYH